MEAELASLFQDLDRRPTLAAYTGMAEELEAHSGNLRPVKVALLSSFTIDPFVSYLKVEAARRGLAAEVYVAPFNSVSQELLDPRSGCARFGPDVVFVSQLLEDLAAPLAESFSQLDSDQVEAAIDRVLADVKTPIEHFRAGSSAAVVVHNFAQRPFPLLGIHEVAARATQTEAIRRLDARLADVVSDLPGVHVLDFDRLCADVGYRRWRNETAWYLGRAALAPEALRELARLASAFMEALVAAPRKCLVLDLDNTLWDGVVGEVGLEGVRIGGDYPGNVYRDFQKAVLELYNQGVLLAILSKNNPGDAEAVLASHPEMVLRPEHFAATRINWRDKPANMLELAEELNLALESLVFFDDNPAEREMMRRMLPQVETLEVPAEPTGFVSALLESRWFDKVSLTEEDRRRGEMYRVERERRDLRRSAASLEEYFEGLGMTALIELLDDLSFKRAHALIQKTNQFNLTTRRHTEARLRAYCASPAAAAFTLRLCDRFGDNGLVGLAIAELEDEAAVIDTFLVSCRVVGRRAETALLAHLADWAHERGARFLEGRTRPTAKNVAFLSFYADHGFRELPSDREEKRWILDLDAVPFVFPPHIRRTVKTPKVTT